MGSVQEHVLPGADSRLVLRSALGVIILVLLCAVQFLDIADSAIVNVALPSIQHSLNFSQQNLQWVASGYILTYGGFLLLGGRLGDLLGRRRLLLIGLTVFAVSSLTAGLAGNSGLLVAARLVQGTGAALMAPAALSQLTTSFREGKDRNTALGVWGAISGMAAAAGVFLGGVISQGPGWRWVFFVNPPICVVVAAGALVLLARDSGTRTRGRLRLEGLRLAGRGPGDRRGAAAGVQPGAGASYRLGIGADHRDPDRVRGPARRVRAQRAPEPQPADSLRRPAGEGAGGGRSDPADRVLWLLLDVLLRHLVHAGDPALLAAAGGSRLSPDHRRVRGGRRHGLSAGHPHRHPSGGGRRLPDRRGRASSGCRGCRCMART